MRGQDALIALRTRGYKPASVELHAGNVPDWFWRDWLTERHPEQRVHARIAIADDEVVGLLDLRCVVNQMVLVTGTNPERCREVFEAAVAAGAKRVQGVIGEQLIDTEAK